MTKRSASDQAEAVCTITNAKKARLLLLQLLPLLLLAVLFVMVNHSKEYSQQMRCHPSAIRTAKKKIRTGGAMREPSVMGKNEWWVVPSGTAKIATITSLLLPSQSKASSWGRPTTPTRPAADPSKAS